MFILRVSKNNMQIVKDDSMNKVFTQLQEISDKIGLEKFSSSRSNSDVEAICYNQNVEFLMKTIGVTLVSNPMDNDEPFIVDRHVVPDTTNFKGAYLDLHPQLMEIESVEDEGFYLKFTAATGDNKYRYTFEGEIYESHMNVHEAKFFSSDQYKTNLIKGSMM